MRVRPPAALGYLLLCILTVSIAAPRASADYAVLRSGQRLEITGFVREGDTVRLTLPGGSVTVPAGDFLSIEPQEVFAAKLAPPHAPTDAPVGLSAPFAQQIHAAAATYALDPLLIESVIAVESNFNPRAISRKSARGLMQLMPGTAARLSVANALDPQQNIDGGARYLRAMLDRYHDDLVLALAAYNAGPDAVDSYRGVPPYVETRYYVAHVLEHLRVRRASNARASARASK